ncbi:MAG: LOG family protein [Planctomycetaceae bacterium]|nr:LOG family protein [Planctomycetaceae bacterium]
MTTNSGGGKPQQNTPALDLSHIEGAVDRFFETSGVQSSLEARELVAEIMLSGLKLVADGADMGQLKLVRSALKEMRHAYRIFNPYRGTHKISIFGSARTPESDPDYQLARDFSRVISEAGWMVITGAGDGIMKAGHEGPDVERCFGLRIRLPFEAGANSVIDGDPKLVNFRYFFTRKLMFMAHSNAVAVFPGGFGTQDELFEALTLIQTGKSNLVPVVLIEHAGGDYWRSWEDGCVKPLAKRRLISPEDSGLYSIHYDAHSAAEEVCEFYKRFHSMRFVGKELVLRLNTPVTDEELHRIDRDFRADLCESGGFRSVGAFDEEEEHRDLPRIAFRFNRRAWSRLRAMIDSLNGSKRGLA